MRPDFKSRASVGRPGRFGSSDDKTLRYSPQPRQKAFHGCGADVVLYGGAAGGGKSLAILAEAWMCARETPGSYGILIRRSFPELERSLIRVSRQLFPRGLAKYNEMTKRWTIKPSKEGPDSEIDFGHCKNKREAEDLYKSAEFTFLGIDETTLLDWDTIRFLMSRSRSSIPGSKPRIVMATNPGGISHFDIKRYFGIGKPDEKHYVLPETIFTPEADEDFDPMPMSRCFIPAKLSDNPALLNNDPLYVKKLMLLPPNQRKMLLEGDWSVFEGRFFTEFTPKNIVAPFDIPKHWKVYRSIDYGYTAPFCCLWFAIAPDGHIYLYRELYLKGLRDIEQAVMVRDFSHEPVEFTTGDPSMFNKNASGISPAENYMTHGGITIFAERSQNDRPLGWMACRNMLANHKDGTPILKVFNTCTNFLMEVEHAVHGENPKFGQSDDINIYSRRDHALDAWRYFAVRRPVVPQEIREDPYINLDNMSRREWNIIDEKVRRIQNGDPRSVLHGMNDDGDGEEKFWPED